MNEMLKLRAQVRKKMDERARDLTNAREAEVKTRTRLLALRAVSGDLESLDLDNLDALNRIQGTLKNTYMESISANKITTATMLGTTLTLAGTDASNNKTSLVMIGDALMRVNDGTTDRMKLSNSGLEIDAASNESSAPSSVIGRGIFNTGAHYAGLWPFSNASRRGWNVRADGVSGGVNGHIRIIATRAAAASPTDTGIWAGLETSVDGSGPGVISGLAGLVIRNMLWVVGPARVGGELQLTSNLNASGNGRIGGSFNVEGSYQNTAGVANFGAGIIAKGNVKADGGALLATNGLNVSGAVILPDGVITNAMIEPLTIGLNSIQNALKDGQRTTYSLRRIGAAWGGTSNAAASANHSHSISFKELPAALRAKLYAGRRKLRSSLTSKTGMAALAKEQLAGRLWLSERLLLALLHMALDDPERAAETREAAIEAGKYHDNSLWRYEGGEAEYRRTHDAVAFLDAEDLAA